METALYESIRTSLDPLRESLEADGYGLELTPTGADGIRVEVVPQADACEDCLIPKESFEIMLRGFLEDAGLEAEAVAIDIHYPADQE